MSENENDLKVEDVIDNEDILNELMGSDKVQLLIQKQIQEALDPIKSKLDGAFDERDKALKDAKEASEKVTSAKAEALESQGKADEATQLRLEAVQEQLKELQESNTKLSRDNMVRDAIKGLDFASDRAADLAYKSIVGELKQDDSGNWVHNSGQTMTDFVKEYSDDEGNSFLFKVKKNSGTGTQPSDSSDTPNPHEGKKLSELTEAEVLKLASEGKLDGDKTFI